MRSLAVYHVSTGLLVHILGFLYASSRPQESSMYSDCIFLCSFARRMFTVVPSPSGTAAENHSSSFSRRIFLQWFPTLLLPCRSLVEAEARHLYSHRFQFETHVLAWTIGAIFVALAIPLSLQDIHMHILHYVSPLQVCLFAAVCLFRTFLKTMACMRSRCTYNIHVPKQEH